MITMMMLIMVIMVMLPMMMMVIIAMMRHSYIKPCISVLGRGLTEFKQIIWFQLRHLSWPISYAI